MKLAVQPGHLDVIGNDRSVREIVPLLEDLKSLGFDERYDLYSELYREGWATDAGYVLLPGLWEALGDVVDLIDFELAYVIGAIQNSALEDPDLGGYSLVVNPCVDRWHLEKIVTLLLKGRVFCNPSLPGRQCDDLVQALTKGMGGIK